MPLDTVTKSEQLWKKFSDRSYRDAFVRSHAISNIAAQVFTLREKRGFTQQQLAEETGMAQARISVIENGTRENITIDTLARLAAAFDVALSVRFVRFSELARWVVDISDEKLAPPSFSDDQLLKSSAQISQSVRGLDDDPFRQKIADLGKLPPINPPSGYALTQAGIINHNLNIRKMQFPGLTSELSGTIL